MITLLKLTRVGGYNPKVIWVNPMHIIAIERTPHLDNMCTRVCFVGSDIRVEETPDQIFNAGYRGQMTNALYRVVDVVEPGEATQKVVDYTEMPSRHPPSSWLAD